jgi:glucose/arabinose dehydrogenase
MPRVNVVFAVVVSLFCSPRRDGAADTTTLAAVSAVSSTSVTSAAAQNVTLGVEEVVSGLDAPVYLTAPAGDSRLFIVEQPGRILIVKEGKLSSRPFLDIRNKVGYGGERGLLSVAFHPQYRVNGFLFVNYTDKNGDTNIERYTVSRDPDVANPASARLILKIDQPYSNHNGGLNLFGPDGMLYIGMGDGGSQMDPHRNGQNTNVLLGKLLRLNVDRGDSYTSAPANPFAKGGGRPEIWAIGLRNPWRFAFDAKDGNLYIGDVGQDKFEEVDVAPMHRAGVNYGWSVMEGLECFRGPGCDQSGLERPALVYPHRQGECSVIGGFVYRGRKIPEIDGHYFYSDYCTSWLKSFRYVNGRVTDQTEWPVGRLASVSSFGQDGLGELYIVAHGGRIYRIVAHGRAGR